jgi:cytochrome c553
LLNPGKSGLEKREGAMSKMKKLFVATAVLAFGAAAGAASALAEEAPPSWAYGFTTPPPSTPPAPATAPAAAPDNTTMHSLAGSKLNFTRAQIANRFGPADWFPEDHPAMPDIVAHGRRPDVRACALCHYPNGKCRAENAPIAGYPVAYFVQQMADFKNGNRKSAEPRKANTNVMITIAKSMTDAEVKEAAEYFGSMKWTPWIKVVETSTVPKTRIAGGLFLTLDGNEKEPLGQRIIEVPENTEATEVLRDPRSGFIAYAPMGSIKKGEALVTTGSGKTTQCAVCHGADLKGLGPVPGIAGRSPSYLVRQMYDMQQGARKGLWGELMTPVVSRLDDADMLAIAAYTASLKP